MVVIILVVVNTIIYWQQLDYNLPLYTTQNTVIGNIYLHLLAQSCRQNIRAKEEYNFHNAILHQQSKIIFQAVINLVSKVYEVYRH